MRVGLGAQALATPLIAPETGPVEQLEPLTAGALQRFLAVHDSLDDLPMAVSLRAFYHVTVSGEPRSVRSCVRALAGSLAALHSSEDLVLVVAAGREELPHWEWAKWLPHVQASGAVDGAGSRRLIGADTRELENLLGTRLTGRPRFHPHATPLPDEPHIVVVLDGVSLPPDSVLANPEGLQGVTVLEIVPGGPTGAGGELDIVVQPGVLRLESGHGAVYEGTPDALSPSPPRRSPGSSPRCGWRPAGTTTSRCWPTWSSPTC